MITIYHNNRCSKSRESLCLLQENSAEINIVDYQKNPPSAKELKDLLFKLKMKPEELVRKGETLYKEQFAGKDFSDAEWINILVNNPILIERPIVVNGDKAVIGRPPEKVKELLGFSL
ncbi:MAG: arsenate reductase (glutaredoxin) [Sphingobacteriales bacterium]|nr:MAG: arsenate reductase (glutaredoxin) [Sphingobacteriales bacterium]